MTPVPAATRTAGSARIALPVGELVELHDRVRVTLPGTARARLRVRELVERIQGDPAELVAAPADVVEAAGQLHLDYPVDARSLPFAAALPRWRAAPAVHLPELLAMAGYLEACARACERASLRVLFAPSCLRYETVPGAWKHGAFRLLAIPLVDPELMHWASASAEAWSWTPGAILLGHAHRDAVGYAIAVALHTVLSGDPAPVRSSAARFRRALRGQLGAREPLEAAVRAALPASFVDEAAAMVDLVCDLLGPEPAHDWRGNLAHVRERLDAHRTAVRWEYEGKIETARGILERLVATTPRARVPWDVVSRLRGRDRDELGAVAAAIDALGGGDGDGVRALIIQLRRIAGDLAAHQPSETGGPGREAISRAIAALDELGPRIGDLGRIHLAHIEARYAERGRDARQRLAARAADPWNDVVRCVILARLHAEDAQWPHAAKLCREVRVATQALPRSGGELGAYVTAYVDFLDGVCHFGAVGQYAEASYLADAFERFVASLDRARPLLGPHHDLVEAGAAWLAWIGALAHQLAMPAARAIAAGIEAYLAAREQPHVVPREVPPLIWYDEERLLSLSRST